MNDVHVNPMRPTLWEPGEDLLNYINGQMQPALGGTWLENVNPSTGQVIGRFPDSDASDVAMAVEAAAAAFPAWSGMSVEKRSALLYRLADLIEGHAEELAAAESADQGKPISLASRTDIPRAVDNFRFFAASIRTFSSESQPVSGGHLNITLRQPIGVVACISPWNLPLYLLTWKIAPALAAGNTVVAKPSELTPLTAYLLGKLCGEAGVPPGVVNLVHGTGLRAGEPLITDPRTPVISFTGGTVTGARIAGLAAPLFKKMSLELGGKNPNIVFADADLEQAVETAVRAAFTNQGEICLCGSRILIQQPIYNTFRDLFLAKVKALTVGDPREQVNLGALVSEGHLHKVLGYVQLARDEGGTVLCGGNRLHPDGSCRDGFFMEPTVIEGLDNTCRTNQEEIFGPVVTLQPFEDEGEALALANGTPFGLAAQVWTSDLSRAHRVAQQLKFGLVWVNCWMIRDLRTPFGGAKASGIGREGGVESLRFFTEPTNVCIKV